MFQAIIDPEEIQECQKKLEENVKKRCDYSGVRKIGYPGGHEECQI